MAEGVDQSTLGVHSVSCPYWRPLSNYGWLMKTDVLEYAIVPICHRWLRLWKSHQSDVGHPQNKTNIISVIVLRGNV